MTPKNEQFIISRLSEIKRLSAILETEEKAYTGRIEAVRLEFANRTADTHSALKIAEKELLACLKKNRLDVFPGSTGRVAVAGGVVLRHVAAMVRKARHITVDFLREKCLDEGIKVEESVNWQKIDTWSDDRLTVIRTERKDKETFAYEVEGS
jgi:hypothetical protein